MKLAPKVLIVSASIGTGHCQAARAVAGALALRYPQFKVNIVDFMSGEYSYLNLFMKQTYLKMLSVSPNMYDLLYRWTQMAGQGGTVHNLLAQMMKKSMLRLLQTHRPDLLVATHPFACGAAAYLKRTGRVTIPLAGVITDFTSHSLWLYPEVDCYFIAAQELEKALVAKGIDERHIYVTGIPIAQHFSTPVDREWAIKRLKLETALPIILIMGGGLGLGGMEQALSCLNQVKDPVQLVVVAGRNKKLRRSTSEVSRNLRHPMRVLGYTSQIRELMAAATLLITKPGALTLSEALAMKLPMVLYEPIPGQEEENAYYLSRQGAACWVKETAHLDIAVSSLLSDTAKLKKMQAKAGALGRSQAASAVVDILAAQFAQSLQNGNFPDVIGGRTCS